MNEKGVQFLFTVAPNKNSLYGENMPYYDSLKVSSDKNLVNLQKYLRQEQVSYGDLYEMLYPLAMTPEEEVYYDRQTTFAYVGEVVSNFDPKITTVNPVKEVWSCSVILLVMHCFRLWQMLIPVRIFPEEYLTR